jgi:hypothetical protein
MVSKLNAERDLLRGIRAILSGDEFFNSPGTEVPNVKTAKASRAHSA